MAKASASSIPLSPPKCWPINMSSSVSEVSSNAVLKVFPIIESQLLDDTAGGAMQFSPFREKPDWGWYPPSPPVYWNQQVSGKLRNNILESITYGQNLENKMV